MHNLDAGTQIDYLKTCNQWLYLLYQIKKQGLEKQQLLRVFDAIITSRITPFYEIFVSRRNCQKFDLENRDQD